MMWYDITERKTNTNIDLSEITLREISMKNRKDGLYYLYSV